MKKIIALAFCLLALPAFAKNIDLSTVPDRDTVQLTIYNSADLTLVRETRKVVFREGVNPLQFSWTGTLIDPTSVQLRFLNHAEKLDVLDTTFPHDRPQVLVWNVGSEHAGEAVIEISYFTSGISWAADYTVIANANESAARVEGHVTVSNQSGEDYAQAQVRLVVGTINLVEQIAELARHAGKKVEQLERQELNGFRQRAARQNVALAESLMSMDATGPAAPAPKQIVKQGLSEYFIFTIEGAEDLDHQSRKRLPSFTADNVPLKVQYRYRPREYGDQLVRLFLMTNQTDSDMGTSPLPDGQVRIFREQPAATNAAGGGGLSFLARQTVSYIPIGDDLELNLGVDPNVGFELITQRTFRDNVWMREQGVQVLTRVDRPGVRIDRRANVVGWDQHAVMVRRVRNDTPRAVDLEIRQAVPGDVTFISRLDATRFDNQNVVYTGTLASGERYDAVYQLSTKQGTNAKQSRVEIIDGDPAVSPW